jgi:hypothetical protein
MEESLSVCLLVRYDEYIRVYTVAEPLSPANKIEKRKEQQLKKRDPVS